jgi:ribosomal protein S18 acetylase RimI-like enzyme
MDRFLAIEDATRDDIAALTTDDGDRYRAFWDWIEDRLPQEPQWYLDHVAVEANSRGQGVGGALIRFGVDRGRRDGVPTVLETARPGNVALYEHLGFRTYLEEEMPGDGPRIWFMRADPA